LVAEPVGELGAKPTHLPTTDVLGHVREGHTMQKTMAALMVGMLALVALPALAEEPTELEQLEAAVQYWADEVERLEGELEVKGVDLDNLAQELEDAEKRKGGLEDEIEQLEGEIEELEKELAAAISIRNTLQQEYDRCATGPTGTGCRNQLENPDGQGPLGDAKREVSALEKELEEKLEELEGLEDELEEVEEIIKMIEDLFDAYDELEKAETALAEYHAGQDNDRHQGCNGIAKAAPKVAENTAGKGKSQAAAVLAQKVEDWDCAA
jgi:chromosome segregation ATPase